MLVSACMLLCVLSPAIINWNEEGSFADSDDDVEVVNYVALGDSMVNGFGMFGYYPNAEDNWNGLTREVEHAFPWMLKEYIEYEKGVPVDLIQLGVSAMRSAELRAILDPTFIGDEYTQDLINDSNGAFNDTLEALPEGYSKNVEGLRAFYKDNITDADLISYCFHYDFGYTLTQDVIMSFIDDGAVEEIDFSPYIDQEYIDIFQQYEGMISEYVYALLAEAGIDLTGWEGMIDFVKGIIKGLAYVTLSYCVNFDKNMEQIYALNPDVEVIVVDSYNTFKGMQMVVGDIKVPLGDIYGFVLELSNIYAKYLSKYSVRTYHASIDDYPTLFTDKFKEVVDDSDLSAEDKAVFIKALYDTIGDDPHSDPALAYVYDTIDGYYFDDYGNKHVNPNVATGNLTKFLKIVFSSTDLDYLYFTTMFEEAEAMLNESVPKLFPDMNNPEASPGYLLTGTVTYNEEDGSCTVYSILGDPITFTKGDLSMLWMNFYVMQSGAVMSHPSVEGHWYVLDCILECIDGFDGIDFGYYEGGFMDITLEDLGIESARLIDIARALQVPSSEEAAEVFVELMDTNAVLATVDSGNLMFLVDEFMSYFSDPEYELDYFQYSALIGGEMSAALDEVKAEFLAAIAEIYEITTDAEMFIKAFQMMVIEKYDYFRQTHGMVAAHLIVSAAKELMPILEELRNEYPDDVEMFIEFLATEVDPLINEFIMWHPDYFGAIVATAVQTMDAEMQEFCAEHQEVIQFIYANLGDIIVDYIDSLKQKGLSLFQNLDPIIFTIERLIYTQMTMYQGIIELDATVKAINPLATMFYAGLYNPLSGVTLIAGDMVIPIGKIMDLYVNLTNFTINQMCEDMDAAVYVDVAGYADTFDPAELVIDIAEFDPSAFMGAESDEPNATMEAITAILIRMARDGDYVENRVFEVMDSMVELPVYNTYWYDGNGDLLWEVLKTVDGYAPSDAYDYEDDIPVKDKDADFRYEFAGTWSAEEDGHVMSYTANFNAIPLKPATEVEGTEATIDVGTILSDPEVTGVVVKNDDMSVTIPRALLEGCETAVVTLKVVDQKDLPGNLIAFTEGKKVISLELFLDGTKTSDFGGEKVTVSVDYALAEGEDASTLAVWYMNEDTMTLDKVESSYENGVISITMEHFSYWVIGHEVVEDEEDKAFPAMVAALLVIVVGLCVALLRLKK